MFDEARDTEKHGGRVSVLLNCPIDLLTGRFVSRINRVALASENTFSNRFRLWGSSTDDLGINGLSGDD